jgi:predicted transcriptional regulator
MFDIASASYIMLLVGIMILSGAFGGMTSAFLRKSDDQPFLMVFFKHTFVGIATAMIVPLILNVFSSDLLDAGQAKPLKLFTLSGLCIFFALFSTRFIESIYRERKPNERQYPPQVQQSGDKGEKKQEARTAPAPPETSEKTKLSGNQLKILRTLVEAEGSKLSLADLLRASAIPQSEFDEILAMLIVRGLVAQELIEGKKLQFVLTARGEQQVKKMPK